MSVDEAIEACQSAVDQLMDVLSSLEAKVESSFERLEGLHGAASNTAEALSSEAEGLVELGESWIVGRADLFDNFRANTESRIVELSENVQDAAISGVDGLKERLEEMWDDAVVESLDNAGEETEQALKSALQDFLDLGDVIRNQLEKEFDEIGKHAADRLHQAVREEGEQTMEQAVGHLFNEFGVATVVAQLQAQTTAALSPYVVPLSVAKRVAPIIRQALEILRMGM